MGEGEVRRRARRRPAGPAPAIMMFERFGVVEVPFVFVVCAGVVAGLGVGKSPFVMPCIDSIADVVV
jgi:hypothetical protein